MNEVAFDVTGLPPAKNEALSMLAAGHSHSSRVVELLRAAQVATAGTDFVPFTGPIGLDVVILAPEGMDPWDATNYLGGIGDVLEDKNRRKQLSLTHLGDLVSVALYRNDRQIREVHYRMEAATDTRYTVRVYRLE